MARSLNPLMETKRAAKALDDIESRDLALAEQVAELTRRVAMVENQNKEIIAQFKAFQTALVDVRDTLKTLLPSLKTQQAAK